MAYVYRHIRLDKSEPFYIGIGSDETYKRAISIVSRNKYWKSITNKTNYEVEILVDDITWEQACEKEKEFILLYGRRDLGKGTLVNMTDGGEGIVGLIHSEETKAKMSITKKGRVLSEKTKAKMRKPKSEETKAKISETMKGRSAHNKGTVHSEEAKQKMYVAKQNMTEEAKAKMREPKPLVTCPYCSREGGGNIMKRHHFDNCKQLNIK